MIAALGIALFLMVFAIDEIASRRAGHAKQLER